MWALIGLWGLILTHVFYKLTTWFYLSIFRRRRRKYWKQIHNAVELVDNGYFYEDTST
jgi:hypothetical protein